MGLVKTYSFPCLPLKREPGKRQSEGQQADQVQGFEMYLKDLCKAFLLDEGRDALKRALIINITALFQFFLPGDPPSSFTIRWSQQEQQRSSSGSRPAVTKKECTVFFVSWICLAADLVVFYLAMGRI